MPWGGGSGKAVHGLAVLILFPLAGCGIAGDDDGLAGCEDGDPRRVAPAVDGVPGRFHPLMGTDSGIVGEEEAVGAVQEAASVGDRA